MQPRSVTIALATSLVLAFSACTQEWNYTRWQPPPSSLVGRWRLDAASQRFLADIGKYRLSEHYLDLMSDGRFRMTNMPDWWGNLEPHGQFESGTGTWALKKDGWHWGLWLTFEVANGRAASFVSDSIAVEGQASPYRLHFVLGDPDQDLFIRLIQGAQAGI